MEHGKHPLVMTESPRIFREYYPLLGQGQNALDLGQIKMRSPSTTSEEDETSWSHNTVEDTLVEINTFSSWNSSFHTGCWVMFLDNILRGDTYSWCQNQGLFNLYLKMLQPTLPPCGIKWCPPPPPHIHVIQNLRRWRYLEIGWLQLYLLKRRSS